MNTIDYSNKKILFTGFSMSVGSEALAGYEFAKAHGATDITALYWGDKAYADKLPADIKKIHVAGNNDFDIGLTTGYDVVFRQNATRPDMIKSPATTTTNLFFELCPAPIIAVTGTKGKGTTSTLIAEILEEAGNTVHLLGNIGVNAIDQLPTIAEDDIVVFEISSFQLWDIQRSPHVAVVLMMAEDHQDVHNSIEEYIEAKAQIVKYQSADDIVIYHPTNEMTKKVVQGAKSHKVKFMSEAGAHISWGKVMIDGEEIMPVEEVGLIGAHNLENITAAVTAAWQYTNDLRSIATAVANFKGLEHRIEEVETKKGVKYYNDSFSTATPAAVAAIKAFDRPTVAIVGGYDKKTPMDDIADALVESGTKFALLMGQTGPAIKKLLDERGYDNYEIDTSDSLDEVVVAASRHAEEGDVVVFSPGCASFDLFDNYKQRGNLFKEAVRKLDD